MSTETKRLTEILYEAKRLVLEIVKTTPYTSERVSITIIGRLIQLASDLIGPHPMPWTLVIQDLEKIADMVRKAQSGDGQ